MKSSNVIWHQGEIGREAREKLLCQKGVCLWFTGLSGSGKSTLAREVERTLYNMGHLSYVLDGDNIRHGLNGDLGFSQEDRRENIRRITEVTKLFVDAGLIVLTAFISPFRQERQRAREVLGSESFAEVYVDCELDICEHRDVKGLYQKARKGEIGDFTGISSPYEKPENPELKVDTGKQDIRESVKIIVNYLIEKGYIKA